MYKLRTLVRTVLLYLRVVGPVRSLRSLVAAIMRTEATVDLAHPQLRHPVTLRLLTSDIATFDQVFLGQEYAVAMSPAPDVILDAGANIGLAATCLASRFPDARIIAIEPEPDNFRQLLKNTRPYPNIEAVQAAVWDREEDLMIVDSGDGEWAFTTQPVTDATAESVQLVKSLTIEGIMTDRGIDHIDLLKVDVEGAEKEIFEDPSPWIDRVDAMIVELHDHMKPGCSRAFYCSTPQFDSEWVGGENVYLSRGKRMTSAKV